MSATQSPISARSTKTQDAFQTIVSNRKSYKMLKGNAEAVWPPYLEEAMLKGFESYEPEDCRETRLLGRFPMRNQYISDYIYRTTGKRRSAKQVGSRLQQLRDTFHGKRLLNSLAQNYKWGRSRSTQKSSSSSDSSCDCSSSESPIPSPSPNSSVMTQPYPTSSDNMSSRCTVVCIDLLPGNPSSPCGACDANEPAEGIFSSDGPTDIFRPSYHPRPICAIDPTVTFVSRSVISAQSSCLVLLDGATIHKEVTPLALAGSSPESHSEDNSLLMYGVKLVPNFWESLCRSPDPTRYTIVQEVRRLSHDATSSVNNDSLMFSAVYHFSYPAETNTPTPSSCSTPVIPEENLLTGPQEPRSNFWYANSPLPADLDTLMHNSDHEMEMEHGRCDIGPTPAFGCISAFTSDNNDMTPNSSFSSRNTVVSLKSSSFPMDLSNYIM